MLEKIYKRVEGLDRIFPGSRDPFRILARLLEECGELAEQVHHLEDVGVKREKHGKPDPQKLAKEMMDVITTVAALSEYYGVEEELEQITDRHYRQLIEEGHIDPLPDDGPA